MLKTKIGHVTVVDSSESTTIIGITHGLAWEKQRINHGVAYKGSLLSRVIENQHFNEALKPS